MGDSPLYDGASPEGLRELIGAEQVYVLDSTGSTMDVAHELAKAGAPAGTIVIADTQTSGRGRGGNNWVSEPGQGIWLTLIERPKEPSVLDVLSLRVGLGAARALDLFADEPIRIKWPNDLYTEGKKLAGILIEARWRELELDWVAIGLGVNVRPAASVDSASLEPGASRIEILSELFPELRAAGEVSGPLSSQEMTEYEGRDFARGRECIEPAMGVVRGITSAGELLIGLADSVVKFRSGSLVLSGQSDGTDSPVQAPVNSTKDIQAERHR